jgi:hypothetical protein
MKPRPIPLSELKDAVNKRWVDKYGEKVRTQWRVEEWQKAYTEMGYYGQDYPAKRLSYSEWFDTKEEAQNYMDSHVPEDANRNELKLNSRTLYRKWIPAHWQETWI